MTLDRRAATPRRTAVATLCALAIAIFGLVFAASFGATSTDFGRIFAGDADPIDLRKIFGLRLPRALVAEAVGAALATSGLVFQALVRNPLASPYVLGVSTGGSFGAVVALSAGMTFVAPAALLGCLGAVVLVYATARTGGRFPASSLLLAGVVVNAFFSAAIMFVNLAAAPRDQERILRWLIGGFRDFYDAGAVAATAGWVLIVSALLWFLSRELNLLSLSDAAAERSGVATRRVRRVLFAAASALTASAVVVSGPIGFVGLVVPHFARLIFGPDHRVLLPVCAFGGAGFLAIVDALAQGIWRTPLPAGVLTAFLGGPLFLILLKRGDRRRAGLDF